jgi:hypothetical protein
VFFLCYYQNNYIKFTKKIKKEKELKKETKKAVKKPQKEKIKNKKTLVLYEITDFMTKKTHFVGFIDGKPKTKKYSTKTALLNNHNNFKKAFNESTLKVVKIDNVNKGVRNYV